MIRPTALLVAASAVLYTVYRYFSGGTCQCTTRLDGLVIIITGGNSGIGKALAFEVASRGAEVILAVRDLKAGFSVQKEIISITNNPNIHVRFLDLNSFDSVTEFSSNILEEFEEIFALVNNAGVFYYPHELTEDQFDVTLQTNYLGHFVLTHYLLRGLRNSEHARIVNVTSEAHRYASEQHLKEILKTQKSPRDNFVSYGATKLALLLFTKELSKKLLNTNIIVNAVNPGNVETNIYRYFPPLANPFLYALQWPIRLLIIKSPRQGAQPLLHALLTSQRCTGQYLTDCTSALPSPLAQNDHFAKEIYNLTLNILENVLSESHC